MNEGRPTWVGSPCSMLGSLARQEVLLGMGQEKRSLRTSTLHLLGRDSGAGFQGNLASAQHSRASVQMLKEKGPSQRQQGTGGLELGLGINGPWCPRSH